MPLILAESVFCILMNKNDTLLLKNEETSVKGALNIPPVQCYNRILIQRTLFHLLKKKLKNFSGERVRMFRKREQREYLWYYTIVITE